MMYTRRSMLKALGATTLFSMCGGIATLGYAGSTDILKETKCTMDTLFTLFIRHDSQAFRESVARETFEYIEKYITLFSRFDADSPLVELNKTGSLAYAPMEMQEVLNSARIHEHTSKGLFNCTVQPMVDFVLKSKNYTAQEYKEARELVRSAEDIHISNNKIAFVHQGMGITLDGIAKGYIIDKTAEFLESKGIVDYMVNAGGDIRVRGMQNSTEPWAIGIQSPKVQQFIAKEFSMKIGAVATSGGYERYNKNNPALNHLINPFTAKSPTTIISATVKAPTAMQADALATTISFMQPQQAIRYVAQYPEASCVLFTERTQFTSQNWNRV